MEFITYEESIKKLEDSFLAKASTEKIFIDVANNRVLAEDIITKENSPNFPTASMDGYAIRYEDQYNGKIKIKGFLPAGSYEDIEISNNECIKTFTGSLMVKGSDTLIPIENVEVQNDYIIIKKDVPKGFSVRPIGENYKKDEVVIKKNSTIGFAEIGVLASLNISQIKVYKKPLIAILSTGSEILDVGEEQTNPSQIRSSNQFTLQALANQAGAKATRLPLQKDNKEQIKSSIKNALKHHDIVVTTGGVSVGDFDFVKDIIENFSPTYITKGVILKPGQHIKIVKIDEKYIFALPGFPFSSTVTFILYVIPLIYHLQGKEGKLKYIKAKMTENYNKKSAKTEFVASNIKYKNGEYLIDFEGKKQGSSAILTNMLGDIALIHIKQHEGDLKAGDIVDAIRLKDL